MTKIKIVDELPPEDVAMLQALYSRSPASVDDHLKKLSGDAVGSFMDRYYVGYGHRSIGDCGTTTLFIEGVTMLAAKAIQDWPLYSGQESSTRYMDFSKAEFADPLRSAETMGIQEKWREFYLAAREPVIAHLRETYPRTDDEKEATYDRAINARCFDILRAWLPAGATTNLSWHTNLRQAQDRLEWMEAHPDPEISSLADAIHHSLSDRYKHSFSPETSDAESRYRRAQMVEDFLDPRDAEFYWEDCSIKPKVFFRYTGPAGEALELDMSEPNPVFSERPRGVMLPRRIGDEVLVRSEFTLDFGSYRDLQRHRAGVIRMPLLTTSIGFHPWYINSLPSEMESQAIDFYQEQKLRIEALGCDPFVAQNYIAMGFQVPCRVTQTLPAFVYRLELRSNKTVHPTLREVVLKEISATRDVFPHVTLHVDEDEDSWTVRRGEQTIKEL